jgi:hypothetical protein
MSFQRAFHWYHSHADPIWPDSTFNKDLLFENFDIWRNKHGRRPQSLSFAICGDRFMKIWRYLMVTQKGMQLTILKPVETEYWDWLWRTKIIVW